MENFVSISLIWSRFWYWSKGGDRSYLRMIKSRRIRSRSKLVKGEYVQNKCFEQG